MPPGAGSWNLSLVIASSLLCSMICSQVEDFPVPIDSAAEDGPHTDEENMHGCECWQWPDCSLNCTSNPILKHTIRSERRLLATLGLPFVLMFPYQDRRMRYRYGTSTAGKRGTYYGSTKFWIHMPDQKRVQMRIQKSNIFGPQAYATLYYKRSNTGQSYPFASNQLDHCFYTGALRTEEDQLDVSNSYVAVDTCHGLRGLIHTTNQSYGIYPLHCTDCQPELLPHVTFPLQSTPIDRGAHLRTFWEPTDVLSQKTPRLNKPPNHMYRIRLLVVMDHLLFTAFQKKLEQSVHYVGSVVNQATKSFQGLPIELHLIRSEIWNLESHIPINSSIKTTLNHLAAYTVRRDQSGTLSNSVSTNAAWLSRQRRQVVTAKKATAASEQTTDMVVLLTATEFADGVEYLAVPDSICTPRSLSVIRVNLSRTAYHTSRLLSLAIADVLGLKSFPCPPRYSCSTGELLSEGDKARVRLALFSGMSDCLVSDTPEAVKFRVDTCGNGQIDRGEECDPGHHLTPPRNVSMSCCDLRTCLADMGTVCTHGACCKDCILAKRGDLCRPARDQCDLPEFCTGSQPNCPTDLYLENGSPCRTQISSYRKPRAYLPGQIQNEISSVDETKALCYQGRCPTRDSHCQTIWGKESSRAADYCFLLHNTQTAGACGVDGENCPTDHALCGLLHCQGGEPRPVSSDAQFGQPFLTYTEHQGRQFECKHLSHRSAVRFVPEGAACAENRYCFQQQCVLPHVALRSTCPTGISNSVQGPLVQPRNTTCSNQGVCTNGGFCLCFPGWSGDACDVPQSVTAVQPTSMKQSTAKLNNALSAPDPETLVRIWTYMERLQQPAEIDNDRSRFRQLTSFYLAIILGSVVGGTFLLLALFLLIYRRRGNSYINRKNRRTKCLPLGRRILPGTAVGQSINNGGEQGSGSSKLLSTMDLKYTPLSSNPDSEHIRPTDRSYFSRWTHGHHRENRSRRKRDHTSDRHHHRRRRRHRKDGNRRWGKHSDDGSAQEWRQMTEFGGMNHSDTELTFRTQQWLDADDNSVDRMIKFGSMPSYKEDKMKREKHPVNKNSSHSLCTPHSEVSTVQLESSNIWTTNSPALAVAVSNNSTLGGGMEIVFPDKVADQRTCHTPTASDRLVIPPMRATSPPGLVEPLIADIRSNQAASICGSTVEIAKALVAKSGTDMPLNTMNSNCTDEVADKFTVLMENSWRQPEKGILKNKHEGGKHRSHRSVDGSSDRLRKHHGHRHHHHHHHKHRRCRHDVSDTEEIHNVPTSFSKCSHHKSGSVKSRSRVDRRRDDDTVDKDPCSPSTSSSESSASSRSSTPSSVGGEAAPHLDRSSSSTSSSTSSCSTALEVGPNGDIRRVGRCGSQTEPMPRDRNRFKPEYDVLGHHSRHNSEKDGEPSKNSRRDQYRCPRRKNSRHRCRHESGPNNSTPTCSSSTAISESTGSSPGIVNCTPSVSGASSSSSSAGRHFHRRRRRRYDTDDDIANPSCSRRSSPLVPTILCNAGQQTDDTGLVSAASGVISHKNRTTKNGTDESEGEWEEIECNESACEECQADLKTTSQQHTTSNDQTIMFNPTSGGHTNPAYIQSLRPSGDFNLSSNQSIQCQQQSTASSSLSSTKNSRIGLPVAPYHPQLSNSSPQGSAVLINNALRTGVTNRGASSSSSSSVAGPIAVPFSRPPVMPGRLPNSEDHTAQHSETEVDAHLLNVAPRPNPPQRNYNSPPTMAPYSVVPACLPHVQQQQPYIVSALGARRLPRSQIPSSHNRSKTNPAIYPENRDCYQHPYEDVATDDYAEANSARLTQQQQSGQHIYYQHGVLQDDTSHTTNGSAYTTRHDPDDDDDEEDDQLSLDEGHHQMLKPTAGFFGRYDASANGSANYPRLRDERIQPGWLADGASVDFREIQPQHRSPRLLPGTHYPLNQYYPNEPQINFPKSPHLVNTDLIMDDGSREFTSSMFRPADIQHHSYGQGQNNTSQNMFHQRPIRQPPSDQGQSNDGTCDGSDTSSLPEPGCDLIQLAQLEVSGRPNLTLSELARKRQQTAQSAHLGGQMAWVPSKNA